MIKENPLTTRRRGL